MIASRPTLLVLGLAIVAVAALAVARAWPDGVPRRAARVGTAACLSCHADRDTYTRTAHHRTTRPATGATIAGSFESGANVLRTSNPSLRFRMDSTSEGFFQAAILAGAGEDSVVRARFDLVVGSGRKGQTYLGWRADSTLVQLPVSFWRGVGWVNSPGYRDGLPDFGRPVTPRCLECHATYLERRTESLEGNAYDPGSAVLGIGCETCHGPGSVHVARERSWMRHLPGTAIIDPGALPRARRVEVCALCHGGVGRSRGEPFSYRPGEPLSAHLERPPFLASPQVDVHGNQVALLMDSPCFQRSSMTCGTCHDVHTTQRDAGAFVARCLECHRIASCGLFPERGAAIARGCVDCHMPSLPSATILSTFEGGTLRPRVRTHRIGIHAPPADR